MSILGARLWQSRLDLPSITLNSVEIDVKDFPLGPPKEKESTGGPSAVVPRPRPIVKPRPAKQAVIIAVDAGVPESSRDAGARATSKDSGGDGSGDGGRKKPGDLRRYGPEGSTLIALLRIDRLRQAPGKDGYIQALDQLLRLLPDRRRLIDGTGFDLYRDFNTLLIATPDPTDDAVTFLATRHGLTDKNLRAGLDRGAQAMGRVLDWKDIGGRPVGIRKRPESKPGEQVPMERDDRIFVLPQPSLAIMATPAHAKLLLGEDIATNSSGSMDGGIRDAGATKPRLRPKSQDKDQWKALIDRIDGEDSAMPDSAVFMMVANQLFRAPAQVVPGTVGAVDENPTRPPGVSFPIPTVLSLLIEIDPAPVLDVTAQFPRVEEAIQWEQDIPSWRTRATRNPIVILSGFSGVIARVEATREENQITLHLTPTTEELQRALNLVANLTKGALRARHGE